MILVQKGFTQVYILIIILIVGGLGGYYYFSKSSPKPASVQTVPTITQKPADETASWKTLTNNYGFSIKYPANLKAVGLGSSGDLSTISTISINENNQERFYINAREKDFSGYKNLTLEEIARQSYDVNINKNSAAFGKVIEPFKQTTLDGKPAYTYTILTKSFTGKWNLWLGSNPSNPVRKLKVIESENNDKHFLLIYTADDVIFDQILSTFKFN